MSARLPVSVRRLPTRVRLAAAIEALPETDRLVLTLRLLEGLSSLETAGALRVTAREVEQRMTAALDLLSQELQSRRPLRKAA
jgi:DNA-directed RNA polymerase specialized sigma24 family protein